jgi:hypothetical protein
MKEKILSIEEFDGYRGSDMYSTYTGVRIVTDQQTIEIAVTDESSCCESFGYNIYPEDISDMVGSNIIHMFDASDIEVGNMYNDEGGQLTVGIVTDNNKVFYISVYNSHNGYYGHGAYFHSTQFSEVTTL